MASKESYLRYILEQTSLLDGIAWRPMMGEYLLYYRGRLFGGIYDDRLLIKPTPAAQRLMPEAPLQVPYEGAKGMLLAENTDDREFLRELVTAVADELPPPGKRS